MALETREIKLFEQDIPKFCWDIPAVPEKFEKKKSVFSFWPLNRPGSSQQGRYGRGRSEIPHFSSNLQLFAPCSRIKRKKAKKSAKKRGDSRQKKGRFPQKSEEKGEIPSSSSAK